MLKFITSFLEIVNWIVLPIAVLGAVFGLAALGGGGSEDAGSGVILIIIVMTCYPIVSIVGIVTASKYADKGNYLIAFFINFVLSLPVLFIVTYLVLSYNGYKLF